VRAGVELPLWGPLSIRAHGELLLPFSRLHLRDSLEQTTFYTTSAAAGTFGLGLVGTVL